MLKVTQEGLHNGAVMNDILNDDSDKDIPVITKSS